MILHRMSTAKGDSGSPLLIQPEGFGGYQYVVGIHCSGKYEDSGVKYE